jgi:hypothetical protein
VVDKTKLNLVDKSTDTLVDLASYKEAKQLEEIARRINPSLTRDTIREAVDFFKAKDEREKENHRKSQFYYQATKR